MKNAAATKQSGETRTKQKRFALLKTQAKSKKAIVVSAHSDSMAEILECIYTAGLLKKRYPHFEIHAICQDSNRAVFEKCESISVVHTYQPNRLRDIVSSEKPEVLYIPDGDTQLQFTTLFSGAKVRIAGGKRRLSNSLSGAYAQGDRNHLAKLKSKGIDLSYTNVSFRLNPADFAPIEFLKEQKPYVWFPLFDEHDLGGQWPVSHAARLARKLEGLQQNLVIPVSQTALSRTSEIDYLKKNGAIIVTNADPMIRLQGMANSICVIGHAGPEILAASLLGVQHFILFDVKTFRGDGLDRGVYFELAQGLERKLTPHVDECINECSQCAYHSCVDTISPERAFENIKKLTMPF